MKVYRVRLQYAVYISAPSTEEAHAKMVKMLREGPEGYIAGIEDGTLARKRSILGRLFLG